jgi:WD40 repeat protein
LLLFGNLLVLSDDNITNIFFTIGHNNNVNGINWSHDGNWLLTSSDDKSAFLWSKGQSEPNMCIKSVLHNMSSDKEGQKKDKVKSRLEQMCNSQM